MNEIWDLSNSISEKEFNKINKDRKNRKENLLYRPNLNELTTENWNITGLVWNLAKDIKEFEYLYNEKDIREIYKLTTYKLLSNLGYIENG